MDQLHLRTLTELLQILLAVVIELVRRFGFVPPGTPEPPQLEVFCVQPCYFCGLTFAGFRPTVPCRRTFPSRFPFVLATWSSGDSGRHHRLVSLRSASMTGGK